MIKTITFFRLVLILMLVVVFSACSQLEKFEGEPNVHQFSVDIFNPSADTLEIRVNGTLALKRAGVSINLLDCKNPINPGKETLLEIFSQRKQKVVYSRTVPSDKFDFGTIRLAYDGGDEAKTSISVPPAANPASSRILFRTNFSASHYTEPVDIVIWEHYKPNIFANVYVQLVTIPNVRPDRYTDFVEVPPLSFASKSGRYMISIYKAGTTEYYDSRHTRQVFQSYLPSEGDIKAIAIVDYLREGSWGIQSESAIDLKPLVATP